MLPKQARRYKKPLSNAGPQDPRRLLEVNCNAKEDEIIVNCNVKEDEIIIFSINLSMYSIVETGIRVLVDRWFQMSCILNCFCFSSYKAK